MSINYDAMLEALDADRAERERKKYQNTSALGDIVTSFEQGLYSMPSALTGLADIPFNLLGADSPISSAADALGDVFWDADQWARDQEREYSDEYLRQRAEVEKAEGFDVVGSLLDNKRVLFGDIAKSLPHMIAGGGLGAAARKGLAKFADKDIGALAAAGVGEGAIMAGASMDEMQQAGVDPQLAAALSTGVGVAGAFIGYKGGQLAERLDIADPEVFLQKFQSRLADDALPDTGPAPADLTDDVISRIMADDAQLAKLVKQATDTTGLQRLGAGAARVGAGGALEAAEEFLQSGTETAAMNVGTGEDVTEGLLTQALRGSVTGAAMGAGTNLALDARAEKNRRKALEIQKGRDEIEEQAQINTATAASNAARDEMEREAANEKWWADKEAYETNRPAWAAESVEKIKKTPGLGKKTLDALGDLSKIETLEDLDAAIDKAFPPKKDGTRTAKNVLVRSALYGSALGQNLKDKATLRAELDAEIQRRMEAAGRAKQEVEEEIVEQADEQPAARPTTTPEQERQLDEILEDAPDDFSDYLDGLDEEDGVQPDGQEVRSEEVQQGEPSQTSVDDDDGVWSLRPQDVPTPDENEDLYSARRDEIPPAERLEEAEENRGALWKTEPGKKVLTAIANVLNNVTDDLQERSISTALGKARGNLRQVRDAVRTNYPELFDKSGRISKGVAETYGKETQELLQTIMSETMATRAEYDKAKGDEAAGGVPLSTVTEGGKNYIKGLRRQLRATNLPSEQRQYFRVMLGLLEYSYEYAPEPRVQAAVKKVMRSFGESDRDAVDELIRAVLFVHHKTREYDAVRHQISKGRTLTTTTRQGRSVTKAIDAPDTDLAYLPKEVTGKEPNVTLKTAREEKKGIRTAVEGDALQGVRGINSLLEDTRSAIEYIESLVGRDNLLEALRISKNQTERGVRGYLAHERSPMVRFSALYRAYRESNGDLDGYIPDAPIRHARKYDKNGKPLNIAVVPDRDPVPITELSKVVDRLGPKGVETLSKLISLGRKYGDAQTIEEVEAAVDKDKTVPDSLKPAVKALRTAFFLEGGELTQSTMRRVVLTAPRMSAETKEQIIKSDFMGSLPLGKLTKKEATPANNKRTKTLPINDQRVTVFDPFGGKTATNADKSGDVDNEAPLRFEEIIETARHRYGMDSPILAGLKHVQMTAIGSPMAGYLAGRLRAILEAGDKTLAKQVSLHLHGQDNKRTNSDGTKLIKYGKISAPAPGRMPYDVHMYGQGINIETFLHETLHTVTYGIMASDPDTLTTKQYAARQHIEKLTDLVIKVAESEPKDSWGAHLAANFLAAVEAAPENKYLEFVTYSLTHKQTQEYLQTLRTGKLLKEGRITQAELDALGQAKSRTKTLWRNFVRMMASLLGVEAAPDSFMYKALDANAGLLGQVYQGANVTGPRATDIFRFKTESSEGLNDLESVRAVFDDANPAAAANAEQIRKERLERKNERRAAMDKQRARQEREKASRQRRAKQGERYAESIELRETTAVPAPRASENTKAYTISKMEEAIFNWAARIITFGKHTTWQGMMQEEVLDRSGSIIRNFVESDPGTSAMDPRFLVGSLLSNVVDQYGLSDRVTNVMDEGEAVKGGSVSLSVAYYDGVMGMPYEQQDAMRKFLQDPTPENLKRITKNKHVQKKVQEVYNELSRLLDRAKAMGMVDKYQEDWGVVDFLNFNTKGTLNVRTGFSVSKLKTPPIENYINEPEVPFDRVVDKDGNDIETSPNRPKKVYLMTTKDPSFVREGRSDFYVPEDVNPAVLQKYQLEYALDKEPYTIVSTGEGGYNLRRLKTPDEIRVERGITATEGKAVAQTSAAVAALLQEWAQKVEGMESIARLQRINADLIEKDPNDGWFYPPRVPEKNDADQSPVPLALRDIRPEKIISPEDATDRNWFRKARVPGYWVKVPEKNSDIFGPLAGQYVAGPIYASIMDYADTEPTLRSKTMRIIMNKWKRNKTVYSTAAHINNVTSNVVLAYANDIPPENIKIATVIIAAEMFPNSKRLQRMVADLRRKGIDVSALLLEKDKAGLTLGQQKTNDIDAQTERDLEEWFREQEANSLNGIKRTFFKYSAAVSNIAGDMYSNQDNVFRLAMYMTHLQNHGQHYGPDGKTLVDGIGPNGQATPDSKSAASNAAKDAFVNYRVHAPWVRAAKDTLLPFVTWTYRMVPQLSKLALTKPWKVANVAAAIYGINALGYAMSGGDEDEERKFLPDYMQGDVSWMSWAPVSVPTHVRLPFSGGSDGPHFINIGRMVPLADLTTVNGVGTPQAAAFGGPLAILMNLGSNFDPFTGREISDKNQPTKDVAMDFLKYTLGATMPGTAVAAAKAIDKTVPIPGINEPDTRPLGTSYDPWTQAAKVLGLNVYHLDPQEDQYAKSQEVASIERSYKSTMAKNWRKAMRKDNPDYEDMIYTQQQLQEDMVRAIVEAYQLDPAEYGLE